MNEEELRKLSAAQRRALARSLAAIDHPHPLLGINLARGRRLGVLVSVVACLVLIAWIFVLEQNLHRSFHTRHWRGAWVGFDFILLIAFAATGWAFWRGRQIVIACLMVTGTLLCCDAWFDVILDLGTSDSWTSIASALLVELPLAFFIFRAAGRLIKLSALAAVSTRGDPPAPDELAGPPGGTAPPLWEIPLLGLPPDPGDHGDG